MPQRKLLEGDDRPLVLDVRTVGESRERLPAHGTQSWERRRRKSILILVHRWF
jgi:hypothetical protein